MDTSEVDLCYLTATEAIAAFKAKKISPVEILEAQIKRIDAINGQLNALTYKFFERALVQAREAEALYVKGAPTRPLEGITCAIKDFHSVKGEITTFGSKCYEDNRMDQTAPTIERLFDAGAIMHCRTTTPEFAHSGITHSPLWGVTRNPWNPQYSPGGSSGGAGAAVSGGMTTLADGTDGGGSIRIPSAACNLYGYKPPFGRNPTDREHPDEAILHYGGLTRSVADSALMQNVMSGQHNADKNSLREKLVLPYHYEGIKGWKIALSMDLGFFEVDEQVQKNIRAAVEVFKSLGCTVDEIDLGWDQSAMDSWLLNWEGLFYALEGERLETSRPMLDPFVAKILEKGRDHTLTQMYNVKRTQFEMYEKLAPVLDDYDVMITPTLALPSVKADRLNDDPLLINGKDVHSYTGWLMTPPFNIVSQCPVMSVPSGWCEKTNIPIGLQIVGRSFDDARVFRAAAAFEGATQPWNKRPDIFSWT